MKQRGLDEGQETSSQLLIRDTRTLSQRLVDFFKDSRNTAILLSMFATAAFLAPSVTDLITLVGVCLFLYGYTRKFTLPFRLPQRSDTLDYNDLISGTNKPRKARGISFMGNSRKTNEELWFSNEDMRTHVLIFGSTGSGKTEALISFAYNSLVQGSGFIYVDGKGDNSLFAKVFSMARSMGREDDVLLINFMTGARDIVGAQEKRLSNTMNPFTRGSSSMLSQLVVSLMESSSQSSDGDMWKGRAIVFVEALMTVLVYMRDQGKILLDANIIRNYFTLDRIEAIVGDKVFPRDNQESVSLADAPPRLLEPITAYLHNLPGYNKSSKGKQVSQVFEQHGFITMQLTRAFGSLADTYGHIIRTNLAEVDLKDVVLNRRILIVLLPALEKAPDELANLGKVIIASLKAMMAAGLGESVEGTYKEVISTKPTTSLTPYMCILDEYGYYAVKGFAVVPAQARSLGFSVIFAGQDLPAFENASKEEAASIGANTNIKLCMKLEDPIQTWEFFSKTAGEAYVTKVDAFQTNAQSVLDNYMDTRSASSEKRARIDLLDLKDQREGEAHIFFKSKIVRARLFFVNPPPVERMRINHFLKVGAPKTRVLVDIENRFEHFVRTLEAGNMTFNGVDAGDPELAIIATAMQDTTQDSLIERGINALLAFHKHRAVGTEAVVDVGVEEVKVEADHLTIFSKLELSELTKTMVGLESLEAFDEPLLYKNKIKSNIELVERVVGKTTVQAQRVTDELLRDMETATLYPMEILETIDVSKACESIKIVCEFLKKMAEKKKGE